jgi:toxin FitB
VNVVDSSAWLEFFAGGANARHFAPVIEDEEQLLVPSLVMFEVFKRVLAQRGEDAALRAAAFMERGVVVDLDRALALAAARLSIEARLPLADSIILATARASGATLWTQDADFEGLASVRYFPK